MTTSNPFEKLHVKRDKDDDEEQDNFEEVKAKDKNVPLGIGQKKKKVRPKEKAPEEEEGDEGFQEVKKGTKKNKGQDEEEEGTGNEHKKRRGINYHTNEEREYRENKKPSRGRKFDRQSGTGRGKEVAKGGAGGKYTWNDNPKNIAKDFENYNDDDYFEEALNPENKERKPRLPRRPKKEDDNGEEEKPNEEGETQEKEGEGRKREKREEKKPYELKPEEKLEKPEGAIYLEDFLKKAEKPKEEEQKEVKRIQDGKPLTKVEDKKEDILGTTGPAKKKGKKKKEKDVNQQEIDLNAEIGAHLQIGESYERGPRRGGRGGRGGRGQGRGGRGRGKGRGGGFVYNPEDFPELK